MFLAGPDSPTVASQIGLAEAAASCQVRRGGGEGQDEPAEMARDASGSGGSRLRTCGSGGQTDGSSGSSSSVGMLQQ